MRYLLDTHLLIWMLAKPDLLPKMVVDIATDLDCDVSSSAVSISEIAIKHKRNRGQPGDMPVNGAQALALADASQIPVLALDAEHAATLDILPLHHRDPFDRLLVAQAIADDRILLTSDAMLVAYGNMVKLV